MKKKSLMAFMSTVSLLIALSAGACSDDVRTKSGPAPDSGNQTSPDSAFTPDGGLTDGGLPGDVLLFPEIRVSPSVITFGDVALGSEESASLTISNEGSAPLRVTSVELIEETIDDAGGAELAKGDAWPTEFVLQPGEQQELSLLYLPKDTSPDRGRIEITSNDPTTAGGVTKVAIDTASLEPAIAAPDFVDLGSVPSGGSADEIIEIRNSGGAPLLIFDVIVTAADSSWKIGFPDTDDPNQPFQEGTLDSDATLQPGEALFIHILYEAADEFPSSNELALYTNLENSPWVISLRAN